MIFDKANRLPKKDTPTRQTRRRGREAVAELARLHAGLLTRAEHALLTLIIERNISYAAIASATGLSKSTVCRRYQRILLKLQSADADRPASAAPDRTDLHIRRLYTQQGLSQTRIAKKLKISRYRVRCGLKRTAASS